jgi:hypothetical protein
MGLSEYSAKSMVRVEFYTRHYHVSGDVEVNRWRLADVLNDHANPFVIIQNAVREPLPGIIGESGSELARAATVLQVGKSTIMFAIPHDAPEMEAARQQYLSALYSERTPAEATVIAPPFEIRGTVHLRRAAQAKQALEELPTEFIPMSHIDVAYLTEQRMRVTADLAVVNRPLAELFTITADRSISVNRGFRRDT